MDLLKYWPSSGPEFQHHLFFWNKFLRTWSIVFSTSQSALANDGWMIQALHPVEAEIHLWMELKGTWMLTLSWKHFYTILKFQQTGVCQFIQLSFKNKSWGFQGSPLLYFKWIFSINDFSNRVNPTPSKGIPRKCHRPRQLWIEWELMFFPKFFRYLCDTLSRTRRQVTPPPRS